MNAFLARGQLLIQQQRYADAERELRQGVAEDPQNPLGHSLLALALSEQKRVDEALSEARTGIGLAPDLAHGHYALAWVLSKADRTTEAKAAIEEAIRLNPDDADYYSLLAAIYLRKEQWREALDAALEGLRVEPDHVGCTNARAIALVQLGRKEEAAHTIDAALAREPENAVSHATQGWALLHQNQPQAAMLHFREALRLDPNLAWAQSGIVEALKAHNVAYRIMLQYFLWMSRLSVQARWGVILGGYFGYRFIVLLQRGIPGLRPLLLAVSVLYLGFAFLTWTAQPLSNLLLRLHPFGRLALPKRQTIASNWVGLCLFISAIAFVGSVLLPATSGKGAFGILALQSLAMVLPVAGVFQAPGKQSQRFLSIYAITLAVIAGIDFVSTLLGSRGASLATIFFVGWIAYSWIANIIISRDRP
jgi:tetratricopeptide (TPR) repeat protein